MIQAELLPQFAVYDFRHFDLKTLIVDSKVLKQNPLGDPARRKSPLLVPKGAPPKNGWPVVLMLSGLTSNGPQSFNVKSFQTSSPEVLDEAVERGEAPRALYLFCDAMTSWGGSQFIDSAGQGRYGTYIADELHEALINANVNAARDASRWCVMGGSSGGYGALQLATLSPEKFGVVIALAPDSFFEASLLPELRSALPIIKKMGGVAAVREELRSGRLMKRKEWHTILNAVAMALTYAPLDNGEPRWPIDLVSGQLLPDVWREWIQADPHEILTMRKEAVRKIDAFYLDAGDRDQFQLQYGTRQIHAALKAIGANVHFAGFDGTHFDLSERRAPAWAWLSTHWRM